MSAFLLGTGFRCDMGTPYRKLVLLKLIDACEEDGTRIFPAVATIAKAAQCSRREVQRTLAAFVDCGLLAIVDEGGRGRGSTREYALDLAVLRRIENDGWDAFVSGEAKPVKGDSQSPLGADNKGDTGDAERVTPATVKGDSSSHPTPPDPSIDPSGEREARAREESSDPKQIEKAFWRTVKDWPGFAGMPKGPARKAWDALSPEEREAAEARRADWLALLRAQKKSHVPAPSTYFNERLWLDVPPAPERPEIVSAPPFGPHWQAVRMTALIAGAGPVPEPPSWELRMVEEGQMSEEELRRNRRARLGFPDVNTLHELAAAGRGCTARPDIEPLAALMEAVPVGSAAWEAWRAVHEDWGWPWLPDPGKQKAVYFPSGGPEQGLEAFVKAAKALAADKDKAA